MIIPSLDPGVLHSWHQRIFDLLFFHSRVALYALMAVLSVFVLIGHHTVPPLDRDEARFAQASKQMLQTGDYITVRFQDELRAKKPAGIYWLQSTFANLLGADDISSYRFVNVLALLASVFALYHMALQFYDSRAAFAAAARGRRVLSRCAPHAGPRASTYSLRISKAAVPARCRQCRDESAQSPASTCWRTHVHNAVRPCTAAACHCR